MTALPASMSDVYTRYLAGELPLGTAADLLRQSAQAWNTKPGSLELDLLPSDERDRAAQLLNQSIQPILVAYIAGDISCESAARQLAPLVLPVGTQLRPVFDERLQVAGGNKPVQKDEGSPMLAMTVPPAIVAPCTADPHVLLTHEDYTVSAHCAAAGKAAIAVLSVRNQYRGKGRVEDFHVSVRGRVADAGAPPGWTVVQEPAPVRGETVVRWTAGKTSSLTRGRTTGGFRLTVEGPTPRFGCHRGIRFSVTEGEEKVPGELQGCLE